MNGRQNDAFSCFTGALEHPETERVWGGLCNKEVIMDEKREERYHELDSLIHSDSFSKTYCGLKY